jgi:hypothetical protein
MLAPEKQEKEVLFTQANKYRLGEGGGRERPWNGVEDEKHVKVEEDSREKQERDSKRKK